MKRSKFMSLRTKLILLCVVIITIPFIFTGFTTYFKYVNDEEEKSEINAEQLIHQIKINVDLFIKDLDRMTLTPFYDENIMSILKEHNAPYSTNPFFRFNDQLKMNSFISSLVYDRAEIRSVLFFAMDGSLFSNLDISVRKQWMQIENDWMNKVFARDGALVILPPHSAHYYLDEVNVNPTIPSSNQYISIARMIKDPLTEENLGIMKIDLNGQVFDEIFARVSVLHNRTLQIYDTNDNLIYPRTAAQSNEIVQLNSLQVSVQSEYSGLIFLLEIPYEELIKDARELTGFVILISAVTIVITVLMSIWASNILIRPIKHLQFAMRLVSEGMLNKRAKVTSLDEIGNLTQDFNKMVDEIEHLFQEVYETKLRERDAELAALQSQINPHFLYNTLETISMVAIRHNDLKVSSIVSSLGKLIRYTIDRHERQVYIKEELRFIDAYLQIQTTRLAGMLQVTLSIPTEFDFCLVPKLFLQPFVENVIEHGMGDAPLHLTITVKSVGNILVVEVNDDGVGMTTTEIDELEKHLISAQSSTVERDTFEKNKHGFALRNVHHRIRLLYGKEYGISVDRQAETGCTFFIRMPLIKEEDNYV